MRIVNIEPANVKMLFDKGLFIEYKHGYNVDALIGNKIYKFRYVEALDPLKELDSQTLANILQYLLDNKEFRESLGIDKSVLDDSLDTLSYLGHKSRPCNVEIREEDTEGV